MRKRTKRKNGIPEALITTKEKQLINEEPITRMEKFGTRPKTEITGTRSCRFCNIPNWSPLHKISRIGVKISTTAGQRDNTQGHADKDKTITEQ